MQPIFTDKFKIAVLSGRIKFADTKRTKRGKIKAKLRIRKLIIETTTSGTATIKYFYRGYVVATQGPFKFEHGYSITVFGAIILDVQLS